MSSHDEQKPQEIMIDLDQSGSTSESEDLRMGEELRRFGKQLVRAVRAVVDSEELRHLGNEVVGSLRNIGDEIQETVDKARTKEEVKAVGEQASRVTHAVTSGEGAQELQSRLSETLRSLNRELNKFIDQMQSSSARMSDEVDATASDTKRRFQEAVERDTAETGVRDYTPVETLSEAFEQEVQPDDDDRPYSADGPEGVLAQERPIDEEPPDSPSEGPHKDGGQF